ncbi:MAG: Rpn family recombination-promoting nuclease/putative transposase [Saprospiraceae bacterium]|nr:Rpn family recombination-promoting nuclease/putative transposase [Saprospiraceae bacterium]MDW8229261.1 Rpn family recombination-promoting nuclease/putative transposase [Saprospiraceae bacterium]
MVALYDLLFKIFFGDVRVVGQLLREFVPRWALEGVDFSYLKRHPTEHVSGRFGTSFSDAIYESRLKKDRNTRVLFLFEHKSTPPRTPIHLQLLDYMLQLWEDDEKNKRPLTQLVLVVLYHGELEWKYRLFYEYFKHLSKGRRRFIPNFDYVLVNLNTIPVETIEALSRSKHLRSMLLALKFARNLEQLTQRLPVILALDEEDEKMLRQALIYFLEKIYAMQDRNFAEELQEGVPKDVQEAFEILENDYWMRRKSELMERIRQVGIEEGFEKGIEKGRQDLARETVMNLLRRFPDMSDADVCSITGLDEETVCALRQKLAEEHGKNGK